MRFDAVVFDSGGTLFENPPRRRGHQEPTSHEVWAGRFVRVASCLQGLRLPFDPYELEKILPELEAEIAEEARNLFSHEQLMQAVLNRLDHEPKMEWACMLADAYAGPRYRSWLFAGVPEMLAAIEEMGMGIHLAVNTPWCGFSFKRALMGVGLLGYFKTRTYSSDIRLAKPDPRFFRVVEARTGAAPARTLYVGDTIEEDIKGSKAAGMAAALRLNDRNRSHADLADYTFTHSSELVAWLVEE